MKSTFRIFGLLMLLAALPVGAANFNDEYGQGNNADEWSFTGAGIVSPVIVNIQSNSVYYITSAKASGQAKFQSVWLKTELPTATLAFYVSTNSYAVTNAEIAGTNLVQISTTNGLGNGDILVLRNTLIDAYQLLVNSNNSSFALRVYGAVSNAITVGDTLYRMQKITSFTPLTMQVITNQVIAPYADWIPMSLPARPFTWSGKLALPSALVLTYSNAGSLFVSGDYVVRPRR